MHRRHCLIGLLSLPLLSFAAPPELPDLPDLKPQGQAQMRFLGLRIYDIRLWVRDQVDAQNWATQHLALELEYARSLSGKEIAKRSLAEMRRQGEISEAKAKTWLAEMEAAFPDVKAGDRITGLQEPGTAAQFYINGKAGRRVADAEFAKLFFGIWLAPQTSEPGLRDKLFEGSGASSAR